MNSLKNKEVRLLPNKKSVKLNYAYFPIGFKNKNQREKAISILLNNNVDSSKIWHGAVNNARRFGYKNDCPNSKIASDTVLLIPNYYDLAKNDVRNISELLKEI
jgi:dTDP-4-amino-4,6-dideoxygalactose transaminase